MNNKAKFGEVFTPPYFVPQFFQQIPEDAFLQKDWKWLDVGAGRGVFAFLLIDKLMESLQVFFPNKQERQQHILENMIYVIEINDEHVPFLQKNFKNVIHQDYLTYQSIHFNVIFGNPPFNCNGLLKVPTNQILSKKQDGKAVWKDFVYHSLSLLEPKGYLCLITPTLWMKPTKDKIHNTLYSYALLKVKCFTNTETNKCFENEAQTPTSIWCLQKDSPKNVVEIYDKQVEDYIEYPLTESLPVFGVSILKKVMSHLKNARPLKVKKTNLPAKHNSLQVQPDSIHKYPNISTCILAKEEAELVIHYSKEPCSFYKQPKLILAHGMYGFPFYDKEGSYGISNRDKYVILDKSNYDFQRISDFLSTYTALYLFECMRYRMKYLEKYIFDYIPDISNLKDFPYLINDETIANYFDFSKQEIDYIQNLHKKNYSFKVNTPAKYAQKNMPTKHFENKSSML